MDYAQPNLDKKRNAPPEWSVNPKMLSLGGLSLLYEKSPGSCKHKVNFSPERVITYIDGFNLYFGLRAKGWRRYYWLDVHLLAQNLLKSHQELMAVQYFTSRVSASSSDPGQVKRQSTYLEAIQTLPITTMSFGHYLNKKIECQKCGNSWMANEEKMTDVNIAVAMLTDAYQNRFDTALLISGDSNLTGPLLEIRQHFPNKRVVVAFPPERQSARLKKEAHAYFVISRKTLKDSQFPDYVPKSDGFVLSRPQEWR